MYRLENWCFLKTFKRFYLRSETVSEEKSQGKNENFAALRAATEKREEKKRKEKNFGSRIVGAKATLGCFSSNLLTKQGARSAPKLLWCFFVRAKRARWRRFKKRSKFCTG